MIGRIESLLLLVASSWRCARRLSTVRPARSNPYYYDILIGIGINIILAGEPESRQRLHRPVFARPRRLHGGRRLLRSCLADR